MATLVDRDYTITVRKEERDLVAPVMRVASIAMEKKHGVSSAFVRVEKIHIVMLEERHLDITWIRILCSVL
jgi:hypothetical protein